MELSFVDSLFMMFKLRKKIEKAKDECKAFDNIHHYNHSFVTVSSTRVWISDCHTWETLLLRKRNRWIFRQEKSQPNTTLKHCYSRIILFYSIVRIFFWNWSISDFLWISLYHSLKGNQCLIVIKVHSLANVIVKKVWAELLILR